ncbi:hypothetical protein F2Q68_00006579 [Brassica cretica]|uniref:MATH domain-containing protein n=1 Tax=Brassica cretica TaxID=69181 RepID=A0A8S9J8J9_BRACR|nr:hypothetical protein F2Q68_00006579 [Brassica cretica]
MKLIRSSLGLLRISPLGDPSVFGLVHSWSVDANGVLAPFREELTTLVVFLSLYLVVPNPESLPSGWRRHAKFSFTVVNQIPGEVSQLREIQYWFDQKDSMQGFQSMIRLRERAR